MNLKKPGPEGYFNSNSGLIIEINFRHDTDLSADPPSFAATRLSGISIFDLYRNVKNWKNNNLGLTDILKRYLKMYSNENLRLPIEILKK